MKGQAAEIHKLRQALISLGGDLAIEQELREEETVRADGNAHDRDKWIELARELAVSVCGSSVEADDTLWGFIQRAKMVARKHARESREGLERRLAEVRAGEAT